MSENKITLPLYWEAVEALRKKQGTPLDEFIYEYELGGDQDATDEWRKRLEEALQYVVENVEPRLLTTDAPEMTVGDSSTDKQQLTNDADGRWECEECNWVIVGECDTCPNCGEARPESGLRACTHFFVPVPPHGYKKCKYCNAPAPDKPDDLAPSPTPSFR